MEDRGKKLKVAMVCSFSNQEVRNFLPLSNGWFYYFVRRCFHLPTAGSKRIYGDVAGWDTYMINNLREHKDIDLYVISAHSGLKKNVVAFESNGVHYWFLKVEVATMLKRVIKSPQLWHKLNPMRPRVRKIVSKIHPDVIALIGAENPHISGTILGIKGIPIIVKGQTIYNNPNRSKYGLVNPKNAYVERLIFKECQYFSYTTKMHYVMFRQFNLSAPNLKWPLGMMYPEVKPIVAKKYDFITFAAGMRRSKGFHDAISALAIVKKQFPDVRLNLTGSYTTEVYDELYRLAIERGVVENISFTPFYENQNDLFQHLQESRYALLPCKLDYIPFTIRQAMHYELPVVCYRTDGTPTLNIKRKCVLIAELGDIEDLATKMIQLLSDNTLSDTLRKNAKEYCAEYEDAQKITDEIVEVLFAIVANYREGTKIPEHLIYHVDD